MTKLRHGHAVRAGGRNPTTEYTIWCGMVRRCTSSKPRYAHWSGRGITVCDRWRTFENFLTDMGPRPSSKHSLDRIDPDRGYEPGNVRWATRVEQNRNLRTVRKLTHNGLTLTVPEWAERLGISVATLRVRLHRGRSVERALEPVKRNER